MRTVMPVFNTMHNEKNHSPYQFSSKQNSRNQFMPQLVTLFVRVHDGGRVLILGGEKPKVVFKTI